MDLSRSLVKEFADIANNKNIKEKPSIYVRGTVKMVGDKKFVQLDGSDALTPLTETVDVQDKDRVLVAIENHTATVLGNFTFPPSARKEQEAVDKAEDAQNSANDAVNKAEDAQNSATDAGNKAQQAGDKADQAIEQTGKVEGLANDAKENAQQAIDAANKAEQNAADAKEFATNADLNAQTARGEAEKAQQAAANAQGEVAKINKEVDTVKGDIAGALTELGNQAAEIQATKETMELQYSKKTEVSEVEANLKTEISKKVGELQTTVEENYSAKTEIVEMEGKLQTQITQNAQGLTSQAQKVEKLESDTTEAKKQVDIALEKADNAALAAGKAQTEASNAQAAANLAKQNAETAATKAEESKIAADKATAAANAADEKLQSAQADLNEAKQNLTDVTNRVGATEEEIADAQKKVDAAQTSVNKALADAAEANLAATNAKNAADKAQTDAANAQADATNAQKKADNAQLAASNAQAAADKAQQDVTALTSRVTEAETKIEQNAEAITLSASKIEEIGKRKSITETTVYWYLSQSATELIGGEWIEGAAPAWKDGSYYWQKVLTKYFDGSTKESTPICLTGPAGRPGQDGADGQNGTAGKGVKSITNYYLATSSGSGITDSTEGWTTTVQTISASKKYLWNYESVTYTDNSNTKTTPCIIGVYGDKGQTGATGATGVGISSITEYYQVSTSNSTVPETWVTTVPTLTATNRYLWNYEKITYTNGTTKETAKRVIGVYGDKGATGNTGATGQGIESITVEYYLSTSKTTQTGGSWTTIMPTWKVDTYLWIRNKIVYKNPTSTAYTTPYCDSSWEAAKDVADDLKNNYYNKTETDAKIKVESDRIDLAVSKVEIVEKSSITSSVEEFYLSTSPTSPVGGYWLSTQPEWTQGKYIWRRTLVTKGDGTTSYTPSQNGVCITGNTGATGEKGDKGDTGATGPQGNTGPQGPAGKGIKFTVITYQTSTSGTTAPTGTWSSTIPSVSQGQYLWSRTVITYTDNTTSTTYSVAYIPKNGSTGATGPTGPAGATGETGTGVSSIEQQYYLSTSKTAQTGGSWVTSMPIWSSGKYLWTRYAITYTNPSSTAYTSPICDSSWEAANDVANDLHNNYYTKTQTDAKIKVESDRITSTVTKVEIIEEDASEALGLANSNQKQITESMSEIAQLSNQISSLVKDENGNSLMIQDSDGWHFNIGAIQNKLNSASNTLATVTNDLDNAEALLNTTKNMVDALDNRTAFIDITTFNGQPAIILGQPNSKFKLRITNTSIDFLDGSEAIAYISNQTLYIMKAIIKDEIQIGEGTGWILKRRSNGNLGLRWSSG